MLVVVLNMPEHRSFQDIIFPMLFISKYAKSYASIMDISLAAAVNLFVLNLVCFISVCPCIQYPKRAGWRTRTLVVVFGFGPGWLLLSTCLF